LDQRKEARGDWRKVRNNNVRIKIFKVAYCSIVGYDTTVFYIIFFLNFHGIIYKNYVCSKC
jgi:hypothetical protein